MEVNFHVTLEESIYNTGFLLFGKAENDIINLLLAEGQNSELHKFERKKIAFVLLELFFFLYFYADCFLKSFPCTTI